MLSRLFRLLNRVGRITVKANTWLGSRLLTRVDALVHRLASTMGGHTNRPTLSSRIEYQVQALSGLIIALLAAVAILVFWATNPQTGSHNPIISFFNPNATPASVEGADLALHPTAEQASGRGYLDGTLVFSMLAGGQEDIFALPTGREVEPIRLTNSPADDRDPVWGPNGQHLAFASRRDGNWELYVLDVPTGEITRLTYDLAFEAAPSWSPDGQWLAYEGYSETNLDIYIVKVDGSEGPYRLTFNPAPDFEPAWTTAPDGREIAYVSWRDGNQDIYILSLDDPNEAAARNVTSSPDLNEDYPAWSPDGLLLAYSVVSEGIPLVYAISLAETRTAAQVIGQGSMPAWSPDGGSFVYVAEKPQGSLLLAAQFGDWNPTIEILTLEAPAADPDWALISLPTNLRGSLAFASTAPIEPAYQETLLPRESPDAPYRLISLPNTVAEAPWLSDQVDTSFITLRQHIEHDAGWDFLGRLDNVWWPLDRPTEPGQDPRNWHKAGRAFDIVQAYNQGNPSQIELIPEAHGPQLYWRLMVRCAVQDGTQGEPLRRLPWDFMARTSEIDAYDTGGRLRESIPTGYFVDFTRLAAIYGWYPTAADGTWRYNWPGVLYWQYEKYDGLDWWTAMLELYSQADLEHIFFTPTPAPVLTPTFTPEVVDETPDEETPTSTPAPPTPAPTPTRTLTIE